jgi:hypothetical protein
MESFEEEKLENNWIIFKDGKKQINLSDVKQINVCDNGICFLLDGTLYKFIEEDLKPIENLKNIKSIQINSKNIYCLDENNTLFKISWKDDKNNVEILMKNVLHFGISEQFGIIYVKNENVIHSWFMNQVMFRLETSKVLDLQNIIKIISNGEIILIHTQSSIIIYNHSYIIYEDDELLDCLDSDIYLRIGKNEYLMEKNNKKKELKLNEKDPYSIFFISNNSNYNLNEKTLYYKKEIIEENVDFIELIGKNICIAKTILKQKITHYIIDEEKEKERKAKREKLKQSITILECAICMYTKKNSVFLPCAHLTSCMKCAQEIFDSTKRCPICRNQIDSILKVFIE